MPPEHDVSIICVVYLLRAINSSWSYHYLKIDSNQNRYAYKPLSAFFHISKFTKNRKQNTLSRAGKKHLNSEGATGEKVHNGLDITKTNRFMRRLLKMLPRA